MNEHTLEYSLDEVNEDHVVTHQSRVELLILQPGGCSQDGTIVQGECIDLLMEEQEG